MCECIISQLFPEQFHGCTPLTPCEAYVADQHQDSLNQDAEPSKADIVEGLVPHFIHEAINRKEWSSIPGAYEEIKKEADGLFAAGTWDYNEVKSRKDLEAKYQKLGKTVHIGHLMTLLSWKHAESPQLRKNLRPVLCSEATQ